MNDRETSAIQDMTGDELIAHWREVQARIEAFADFPELVEETVSDDGETYQAMRCPVCSGLVSDAGDLYAVDVSERWSSAEPDAECSGIDISDGDTDYGATLFYWHDAHPQGHAVALPSGWRENWS